jgi:hypothetical protein
MNVAALIRKSTTAQQPIRARTPMTSQAAVLPTRGAASVR